MRERKEVTDKRARLQEERRQLRASWLEVMLYWKKEAGEWDLKLRSTLERSPRMRGH